MQFVRFAGLILCLLVAGCLKDSPNYQVIGTGGAPTAVISSHSEALTQDVIESRLRVPPASAYRLGPSDVISLSVYGHPELSIPQASGGSSNGALITSDGTVQLPLIGNVNLNGLTLTEAQHVITHAYAVYLQDPKVAVTLLEAQSLRYYLLGEFTSPGVKYPVQPLPVLDVLALGGSVDLSNADLYQAYVARGSAKLPLDLHALLVGGDLSQNVMLAPGDVIVVPSAATESAFVLGAVGKPGAISFQNGSLSLLQALASAGMDLSNYTQARLGDVHVIRPGARSAEFYIVDANLILRGYAQPFALQPGDVVFVPPSGLATWNQILTMITPAFASAASVLAPFVQIKYLQQ